MKLLKSSLLIIYSIFFTIQLNSQTNYTIKIKNDTVIDNRYIKVNYNLINTSSNSVDKKTAYYYLKISDADTLQLAMENNYIFEKNFIISFNKKNTIVTARNNKKVFNDAMLNVLFAEEVSGFISDSKDLSLQKTYAVLSTADKSLFFGYTFQGGRDSKIKKLTHVFTVGLKAKLNEEFTTLLNQDNGNLDNEIGLNFKYTHVNRGRISYFENKIENINNLSNKVLVPKYGSKVEDANNNGTYSKDLQDNKDIYVTSKLDPSTYTQKDSIDYSLKYYTEKYENLYLELAEEELKRLRSEKLYTFIEDTYWSIEAFIPASRTFYNVAPIIDANLTSNTIESKAFYPWKINADLTWFRKYLEGNTFFVSGFISAFNNNNIIAEDLSAKTFNIVNSNNSNVLNTTKTFYDESLNRFTTGSIGAEIIGYFMFKGALGLSFAIEQNIGNHYNPRNWKFGIPISLKDKEKKPTVNLELQFKKVNNEDFLGIAVGYTFGKYVK